MTIEYKDSKRIVALSTDYVPDISDTSDSNWTVTGLNYAINSGVIDWDGVRDSSVDGIHIDLGAGNISDTQWVLRFKMVTDAVSSPSTGSNIIFIAVSDAGVQPQSTGSEDSLGYYERRHNSTAHKQTVGYGDEASLLQNIDDFNITAPTTETKYIEMKRTSATSFTVTRYSDEFVTVKETAKTVTIPSTIQSLRYIKIQNKQEAGGGGTFNGTISDIKFWNDTTTAGVTAKNHLTNVQDNSLLVEKDVARRYWFSITPVNGYDVANISYSGKSSSSSSENTYMLGIGFNADGTKMYRTGYSPTKAIFQYTLSTAWDISTSSYDNVSFSLPNPIAVPYGIEWNGDGTKFVIGDNSTGDLFQFTLSTAYDISTTNSTPTTYDPSETSKPVAFKFFNNGLNAFLVSQNTDYVYKYTLSTAYDISTMSYATNSLSYTGSYYISGMEINSDGTELYLMDHTGNSLRRYTLSTAYDLSTASLTSSFSTSSQFSANTASALRFSADGTKLYISGYGASDQQYSTGTAEARTWTWSNPKSIGRGIFASGTSSNVIDYITIATTGNATDFGDSLKTGHDGSAVGSILRAVFGGGTGSTTDSRLEYISFKTLGNATAFGAMPSGNIGGNSAACGDGSRGIWGQNTSMDYITIDTAASATSFGTLGNNHGSDPASCADATRGLWGGGEPSSDTNAISYVTIQTTGNSTDFGDLTVARRQFGACADATRGVFGAGYNGSYLNTMDYVTIATTGNASDFGDLTVARVDCSGALADATRGVWGGGNNGSNLNTIDYITIQTTGNATDFGDLTAARNRVNGASDHVK